MLDHLVYDTPSLATTVADLAARGLHTVPGGPHVGLGTRNHLASLGGGAYLEVIGPDPDQAAPGVPRPFGVDDLPSPALVAWCARPQRSLEEVVAAARATGFDPGRISDMSRRRPDGVLLEWRLTLREEPAGVLPFFIDWLDAPHPTSSMADAARLERFVVHDQDPARVREILAAIGERDDLPLVQAGATALQALIRLPDGNTLEL